MEIEIEKREEVKIGIDSFVPLEKEEKEKVKEHIKNSLIEEEKENSVKSDESEKESQNKKSEIENTQNEENFENMSFEKKDVGVKGGIINKEAIGKIIETPVEIEIEKREEVKIGIDSFVPLEKEKEKDKEIKNEENFENMSFENKEVGVKGGVQGEIIETPVEIEIEKREEVKIGIDSFVPLEKEKEKDKEIKNEENFENMSFENKEVGVKGGVQGEIIETPVEIEIEKREEVKIGIDSFVPLDKADKEKVKEHIKNSLLEEEKSEKEILENSVKTEKMEEVPLEENKEVEKMEEAPLEKNEEHSVKTDKDAKSLNGEEVETK